MFKIRLSRPMHMLMARSRLALLSVSLAAVVACGRDAGTPDLGPPPPRAPPAAGDMRLQAAMKSINPRLLRRFKSVGTVIGEKLYFDTRLSRDGDLACNTCHPLNQYGADHQPTSVGHGKLRGRRNSPTVIHAAGHLAQFWDGRARDVEEQAKGPIVNPAEMAMVGPTEVVAVLTSIPGYVVTFKEAFPGEANPITYDNIGRAIGSFERRLVTRSRWDHFLDGDHTALTAEELEGLKIFADVGCVQCHTGEYLGGSMFQKVGSIEPWPNQTDQGRYELTNQEGDRMQFKVPSLRNITKTAPYFHDGSVATLDVAVREMSRYQLGVPLNDQEVQLIVAWLGCLTGDLPVAYTTPPQLPPDGPRTAQMARQ
jgi:cytochrome c peroxidase